MTRKEFESPVWWFLSLSILVTLGLFYIDEGYYDFRWMTNMGNWVVFFLYVITLVSAQLMIDQLIRRLLHRPRLSFVSMLIGLPGALAFLFWILS
ncbi:MAG: hypothetical protein H6608_12680 [Flavobacteriales bacterium]|nr:hypothetical protein [Bacteroidota bacterium]MCB9241988.1 hypothetical protein [Flavobacteriales bacterium]